LGASTVEGATKLLKPTPFFLRLTVQQNCYSSVHYKNVSESKPRPLPRILGQKGQ